MEHLARPLSPVEEQIQVSYVGAKPYDRGSFLEYPGREGWHEAIELISQETHTNYQANWTRFTAFLQRWLFFGLLHEFFLDDFKEPDYIRKGTHDEDILTTACLNEKILSLKEFELSKPTGWEVRLHARDEAIQRARMTLIGLPLKAGEIDGPVLLCLCVLHDSLSSVNSSIQIATKEWPPEVRIAEGAKLVQALQREEWQEQLPVDVRRKVVDKVTAAMLEERLQGPDEINALLIELGLLSQRYESPAVGLPGSMVELLRHRFQSRGWCPREIQMITQNCNVSCQLYISQLDRPGDLKDHQIKGCDAEECYAYQVSQIDYRTEHAITGCCCEDVEVDSKLVYAVLQKDKIPVIAIEIQEDDDLKLSVIEADSDAQYIAFSHVWSDGLGNPHKNALPRCQILRLYRYCNQMGSPAKYFWVDTLCCPREPLQATVQAIRLMRRTYQEAAVVLVLDAWLQQQQPRSISSVELLMRITLSGWTRRLWTFQEGSINKNVGVIFADKIVDLDSLAGNINFFDHPSTLPMLRYLITVHDELRTLHLSESHDTREKFRRLVPCFRYRATSRVTDEPICLSVIFNLDTDHIWQATDQDRMKEFWNTLPYIPPDVVFFDAPKCPQKGFKWAPATLFGGKQNQRFSNIHAMSLPPAQKTPDGLVVNLPGFVLSGGMVEDTVNRPKDLFEFRDQNSRHYWMRQLPMADGALPHIEGQKMSLRLAVIYLGFPAASWQLAISPAILVSDSTDGELENRFSTVNFMQYVILCRVPGVSEKSLPVVDMSEARDWCVD